MIGKVTVKSKNPPCKYCGGMAGYHTRDCERPEDHKLPPKKRGVTR